MAVHVRAVPRLGPHIRLGEQRLRFISSVCKVGLCDQQGLSPAGFLASGLPRAGAGLGAAQERPLHLSSIGRPALCGVGSQGREPESAVLSPLGGPLSGVCAHPALRVLQNLGRAHTAVPNRLRSVAMGFYNMLRGARG